VYANPLDAHAGEDRSPALTSIPVLLADRLHVVELREPPRGLRNRIGVPELVFAVAERWATGSRTDEIADELVISPLTVRTYVQRVYRRLGVNNRVALLNALALGSGCSEPREPCAAVDAQDRTPPEAAAGAPPPATSTESVDPR
jgi:hypothetical protein